MSAGLPRQQEPSPNDRAHIASSEHWTVLQPILRDNDWPRLLQSPDLCTYLTHHCAICGLWQNRCQELHGHYRLHHTAQFRGALVKSSQLCQVLELTSPCGLCGRSYQRTHSCAVATQVMVLALNMLSPEDREAAVLLCDVCQLAHTSMAEVHQHLNQAHGLQVHDWCPARDALPYSDGCSHCGETYQTRAGQISTETLTAEQRPWRSMDGLPRAAAILPTDHDVQNRAQLSAAFPHVMGRGISCDGADPTPASATSNGLSVLAAGVGDVPIFAGAQTLEHTTVLYRVVAAFAHLGGITGGHYQALLRLPACWNAMSQSGTWYHCDDCRKPVSCRDIPLGFCDNVTCFWLCRVDAQGSDTVPVSPAQSAESAFNSRTAVMDMFRHLS